MKIKLSQSNRAAIDIVVSESIAGAETHTTHSGALLEFAHAMELKLAALDIPKRDRSGAMGIGVSGGSVPRAYKYCRIVSRYKIIRGASDWFLIDLYRVNCYGNAPADDLKLTTEQAAIAVASFCKQFSTQTEVSVVVSSASVAP